MAIARGGTNSWRRSSVVVPTLARTGGRDYDAAYEITLEDRDHLLVLALRGRVMREISQEFLREVRLCLRRSQASHLLIDFGGCEHIASSALGHLVRFCRDLTEAGVMLSALRPGERVRNLLDVLGLEQVLHFSVDEPAARRRFGLDRPSPG